MLECRLLSWCINKTTIIRNNYWIFFFQFSCIKKYTHFSAQSTFPFCIMSWVNKNLNRKAWNHVIKIQVRLNESHILYFSSVTLRAVLPSYIIPVRGTRQQEKKTISLIDRYGSGLGETYTEKPWTQPVCHKKLRETKSEITFLIYQAWPSKRYYPPTYNRRLEGQDNRTETIITF